MTRFEVEILIVLMLSPGMRKREIAGWLRIWQCNSDFLSAMNRLEQQGKIRRETVRDIGNMEYYDKWYAVE